MATEKQISNRQFKDVVNITSWEKMATIILAVQIINENVQINNSRGKEKK